ncbi:MAG: hypothetical protein J6D42_11785 [Clostridia bacterium]|nr:hypothetical protein [Clostridia bacterium]
MIAYLDYLNLPTKIGLGVVGLLAILQVVGELLEFKGKIVPEFMKIRKYFSRKKKEREDAAQTMKDVQSLLNDVNGHYSADNIAKRDSWMKWVDDRAVAYDTFIKEISDKFADVTKALNDNTKMTEEMFVQQSRDRIIDFATKAGNKDVMVSREEYNRIFKVYDQYEQFLEDHKMTNGEIDVNYQIIKESYEERTRDHNFVEDIREQRK